MPHTIDFPFPLKGYDAGAAFASQPAGTTPSCLNVRAYSCDSQRSRGGSRPGLQRAYAQRVGGGAPVQWLGWLDCGFGDAVGYRDRFEYGEGALKTAQGSRWTQADDATLVVTGGCAHLDADTLDVLKSAGPFQGFAGDTWDQFVLEAQVEWAYATTGRLEFWVGSDSDGTDGVYVVLANTSTEISWPGMGFSNVLSISVQQPSSATWSTSFGPFFSVTGGLLRVEADASAVRVIWKGDEVLAVPRVSSSPCATAGFKMFKHNPAVNVSLPDSAVDIRLLDWSLQAISDATDVQRRLVAVAGRKVWAEASDGVLAQNAEDEDELADVPLISAAPCNGRLFLLDGQTPRFYDPMAAANRVQDWTARQGQIASACRLVTNWRNRLVLAGNPQDPLNYYMSRQGDPWDFSYGESDAATAVTGELSEAGRAADPIVALCPLGADTLVLGCTRSIWVLRGDPAHGGSLLLHSPQTGIVGPNAWTTDVEGNLYFLGEGGLYVMTDGGGPKNLSASRLPQFGPYQGVACGQAAQAGQHYVSLAYDVARQGIAVFLSPKDSGAATHWFYDLRNEALFPESYPAAVGPTCAAYYHAASPAYRRLLLGGRNGWLYEFGESVKSDVVDAGTTVPIASHVWLLPATKADGLRDSVLTRLSGTLSVGSDATAYELHAADSAESLLDSAAAASGTWSAGRNADCRSRVRGVAHAVRLSNATAGQAWAVEKVVGEFGEPLPHR